MIFKAMCKQVDPASNEIILAVSHMPFWKQLKLITFFSGLLGSSARNASVAITLSGNH